MSEVSQKNVENLHLFSLMTGREGAGRKWRTDLPSIYARWTFTIWDPNAKGVYYGLDFSKTKRTSDSCSNGRCSVFIKTQPGYRRKDGSESRRAACNGGSANSLLWTQIKCDVTGKPITVPSSDTATTLGAVMLAGVGIGMYKDFDEAVKLTIEEKRSHEPNNRKQKSLR